MQLLKDIRKNKYLYLLGLPGLVFLTIFAYIPMLGHVIAFKEYRLKDGILGSKFIGFDNFKFFFLGKEWIRVTANTLFLNSLFLLFGITTAVLVAVFLNEISHKAFKKTIQSLVFLPYFVSWVVVYFMTVTLLSTSEGLINNVLIKLGFEGVNWYGTPAVWPWILTILYVWKFAGYYSIIFLAAITGISSEYYESAKIDGATRFQQILHITLPLIRPTVIILTLLGVGRIFYGDFGMIYGIIGDIGTLYSTTDVIDTYTFRALRQLGDFGMSSAVVLYQSVMGLIVVVIFNKIVKKIDNSSGLF